MTTATFATRRTALEEYFDRTALDAWTQLTSDAPVSKVRATVRAGRDRMRAQLLSWLPQELCGARLLDAGCGTGALAFEAAARGAEVVGVDVSQSLIEIAQKRTPPALAKHPLLFRCGDMLAPPGGPFDHVVAMDSLIHYETDDIVAALVRLGRVAQRSILFTVAPRTPALMAMFTVGKLFPRSDRRPALVPVGTEALKRRLAAEPGLADWAVAREERVISGFYTSHALELVRR